MFSGGLESYRVYGFHQFARDDTKVRRVDSTEQNSTVDYFKQCIKSLKHHTQSKGSNSRVLAENRKEIGQLGIFSVRCAQFF
jgi:hypothetical protein